MSEITLVKQPISLDEVKRIAEERFGDMVKAVVDIELDVMAIGASMHADEEAYLLDRGSKQENLWGINIYHELPMPDRIEFDSMINIRPKQDNKSRDVESEDVRSKIVEVVSGLVTE